MPPPRRKALAKKSKASLSTYIATLSTYIAHYPFILVKAKTVFDETIKGKQLTKERALGLENYETDKVIQDIITYLG